MHARNYVHFHSASRQNAETKFLEISREMFRNLVLYNPIYLQLHTPNKHRLCFDRIVTKPYTNIAAVPKQSYKESLYIQ
jgi:hypothetical protein